VIELGFSLDCSRGGRRPTGTDRGSVPKDRLTPASTHTKAVYEVLRREEIPLKVNRS